MLIRGPLQADNAGIRQELENAFRGQSDFMRYQSLVYGRLWNDRGKVRTNRNGLVFGDALSNSTDPLVTLLRVLKDGKLGTLPVDNNTLELAEYVSGYRFGSWETISGACSLGCCFKNGSITQNRTCSAKVSNSCSGILLKRELSCVDFCKNCRDGQSTTVVTPSSTGAPLPTSTTGGPVPTSTTGGPVPTSTTGEPTPATTGGAPAPSSTSAAANTASATASPTTQSSMKPSCATVSFIANMTWNASFADKNSNLYKNGETFVSMTMEYLYNDSKKYDDVKVSELVFSEKDSLMMVKVKLCLVVKTNDGSLIEDVFKAKVKTGYLHANMPVKTYGAEFESLGFTDWKAKDDECEKCEGAGGEFVIEGTCEDKTYSCKGLKNTKMTKDCVEYCPSSAVTFTISSLILAIGMFLSLSFQ